MNHLDVDQWRRLVVGGPMLAWRAGTDSVRCDFNRAWQTSTGMSLAALEHDGWWQAVHSDDRGALQAALRASPRAPFEHRYRLQAADGGWHTVHDAGAPIVDDHGVWAGTVGSAVVIDALDADAFFEMSLDHLAISSLGGELRRLNSAWTRTLGYSRAELLAMAPNSLVHPDDLEATDQARDELLRHGKSLSGHVNRYRCKDGSYRSFEWHSVADVERGLVYASARDITVQRQAQAQLEHLHRKLVVSDRMASIGTLAGGVAHEINNPLAAVVANIDLIVEELARRTPASTELLAMARDVQHGAARIAAIVDSLRTFSRGDAEQRVVLDVHEVIELAIAMTNSELRHHTRLIKHFGQVPNVRVDRSRLAQVFIHLLINAGQAITPLSTNNTIEITTAAEGNTVVVDIVDHGAGMPAEVLERAFDPFFTTRDVGVGSGLGLSVCRNIISSLDGTIQLDSHVGSGTRVRVVLPATSSEPAATAPVQPPVVAQPKRRARVLVVDDEPAVGVVLVRVLREHEVVAVASVVDAVAAIEAAPQFDLVLSDVMMPEQSGVDFFRILQERFAALADRVVFMSGGAFTPAAQVFLEGRRRLDKPFDARQVRELVASAIADHHQS